MSCINISVEINPTGRVSTTNPATMVVSANTMGTGWFGANVLNKKPKITATKVGHVSVEAYLVCSTSTGDYLFVSPHEPMWLTINGIDYSIYTNKDWTIE